MHNIVVVEVLEAKDQLRDVELYFVLFEPLLLAEDSA